MTTTSTTLHPLTASSGSTSCPSPPLTASSLPRTPQNAAAAATATLRSSSAATVVPPPLSPSGTTRRPPLDTTRRPIPSDHRSTTPYGERVQRLNQRLSGIHAGLESERQLRENLYQQIGSLQSRVEEFRGESQGDLQVLQKQVAGLSETFQIEGEMRKQYESTQNRDIKEIRLHMTETIDKIRVRAQEAEQKCLTEFEIKTNALRDELLKEHLNLVDTQTLMQQYCNVEIPKVHESLKLETKARAEMEERVLAEAAKHISKVAELVEREKKERENQSQSFLQLIEQVVSKTQALLQKEREERVATEGILFQLLEDTICKLDVATRL